MEEGLDMLHSGMSIEEDAVSDAGEGEEEEEDTYEVEWGGSSGMIVSLGYTRALVLLI